ncbi:MAG: hypothetical protein HFH00_11960 [Dorea sp.]|nr:hypothetical protein [Dorea sp.]
MIYWGNIVYDEELKNKSNRFSIYGARGAGRKIYEYMELNGLAGQVEYFCDGDREIQRQTYRGVSIIDPEEMLRNQEIHVLVGGRAAYEKLKFLTEHHINNVHILEFW